MDKEIIFYSNQCIPSKQLLSILTKNSIENNFRLICIDEKNVNLPNYLTKVPTLVTKNKNILVEDDLFNYINELLKKNTNKDDIDAYFPELSNGFSDSYSYLDDGNKSHAHTFSYLDMNLPQITTPDDKDYSTNNKKKGDNSDYDRLLKERESDIFSKGIQRT